MNITFISIRLHNILPIPGATKTSKGRYILRASLCDFFTLSFLVREYQNSSNHWYKIKKQILKIHRINCFNFPTICLIILCGFYVWVWRGSTMYRNTMYALDQWSNLFQGTIWAYTSNYVSIICISSLGVYCPAWMHGLSLNLIVTRLYVDDNVLETAYFTSKQNR